MKLLVSGDSFTKGLIKVPNRNTEEEQNKINWGTQLGKLLNSEVINLSHWGSGTDYITYSILNYLKNTEDRDFFVIASYSGLERQWGGPPTAKYIYQGPHYRTENYKELFFKNEMMIRGFHQFLKEENIPHFFTNAFCDLKYANENLTDDCFNLGNSEIKDYWLNWEYDSNTLYNIILGNYLEPNPIYMHSTQSEKDFHRGTKYIAGCLHPNEEGHKLIAKTLLPYVKPYFK